MANYYHILCFSILVKLVSSIPQQTIDGYPMPSSARQFQQNSCFVHLPYGRPIIDRKYCFGHGQHFRKRETCLVVRNSPNPFYVVDEEKCADNGKGREECSITYYRTERHGGRCYKNKIGSEGCVVNRRFYTKNHSMGGIDIEKCIF